MSPLPPQAPVLRSSSPRPTKIDQIENFVGLVFFFGGGGGAEELGEVSYYTAFFLKKIKV